MHDESCYSTKQKQVCQIEEHVHDSDCYDGNGKLICEKDEHQHGEDCFEEVWELVCEIPESPGHQHDDSCYQKVLTCGREVHTHSTACYRADTASQAATEAIAVASTESAAAAATGNGLVDNLNDPVENGEPETSLDSSIENNVIEGNLDASPDYSEPGSDSTSLTNEGDKDEPEAWTSTEATADATAATAASTGSGAGVTGSTAAVTGSTTGGTAATVASAGATDTMSAAAGYVPVLDELNFDTLLNKHTRIYYSRLAGTDSAVDNEIDGTDATADVGGTQEEAAAANTGETQAKESDLWTNSGEKQEEAIAENTGELQEVATWNRIDKHTELKESDNVRLYLAYTIPAGSLNETNQTARYSLPKNIHLTDEQVNEINATVNGIARQYVSYDTLEILDQEMYGKYLGIEAVEGTRTPADDLDEYLANNEGQEFISATVKVENVFDENTGLMKAQDLVFTFAPYTIQKNQHQYDSEGKPTKAGEEVNGWLAIDISTEQIDWEKTDDETKTADIIFVEKDKVSDLKEISTELRLVGAEADSDTDTNVGNVANGVSTDVAATDNKQDGTKDSETAAGESDKAEKEQVNYPSVSFDDSITVAGGVLPTDTDEASGDAGMAAETEITVHVEADKDTFPEGTTMVLSAVSDDQMTAVAEAVEGAVDAPKTMGFHAVDISFRDVKGNEIEPLKPIRVSMTSDAIRRAVQDESTTPVVVHVSDSSADQDAADENMDDGGSTDTTDADEAEGAYSQHILEPSESKEEQVTGSNLETAPSANIIETDTGTKENNGDTLTFDVEDFSVYAIVYTVDFHWEVDGKTYVFNIPGGGFVSFYNLIKVLGIEVNDTSTETDEIQELVDGVESLNFSNSELVSVSNVEEDTTVGAIKENLGLECEYSAELTEKKIAEINEQEVRAGDWALISLKPFNTEESLTVTMKNGDRCTIKVTDAQKISNADNVDSGVYYIYNNSYRFLQANNGTNNVDVVEEIPENEDAYKWIVTRDNDTVTIKSFVSDIYLTLGGETNSYDLFSETSAPITLSGNNGITIENADGDKLGWGGSSKPYYVVKAASGSSSKMTFYKLNAEAPTFTVKVQGQDTSKGTVTGTGTNGSNNNVASYVTTIKANGTNNNSITANPALGFKFKCWLLNDVELPHHDNVIDAGSMSVSNQDVLTAVFEVDPDYNQVIDDTDYEAMIEAWKERLFKDQLVGDKTAQVYDYDNRIYQVDMSATSGYKVIDPTVELVFVTDVSRSMYFPAMLDNEISVGGTTPTKVKDWLNSSAADKNKTYYVIGDPTTNATVYALKYTDTYSDTYFDRNGKLCYNAPSKHSSKTWCWVDASYFEPDDKDGNTSKRLIPLANSDAKLFDDKVMDGYIYESTDPNGWYRMNYLKQAVTMASDVVFDLDPTAKIGLVTFAADAETKGTYTKTGTGGTKSLDQLKNDVVRISGASKTDQRKGLQKAYDDFFSETGKNRIVVLITDGAPNPDKVNGNSVTLGWTRTLNPGSDYYIEDPANSLKGKKVNLYTVGLSLDNVTGAEAGLTAVSSGDGYHFAAEDSSELVDIIEHIVDEAFYPVRADGTVIQQGLYGCDRLGNVDYTNVLGENIAQYVDQNGNPISDTYTTYESHWVIDGGHYENRPYWDFWTGRYVPYNWVWVDDWKKVTETIVVERNPILNDTPCCLWKENLDGTWTVTYYNQEFDRKTDNDPTGWDTSFYVKAKEDFMGGNTISTNSGDATIVADRYIPEGKTTIKEFDDKSLIPLTKELETPHVNVDELHITEHSTEWTVYLGTEVKPEDQLAALWNNIKIKEVVKKSGTKEDYSLVKDKNQMWYQHGTQADNADKDEPTDDDNCELVPLSHYGLESYYTSLLNALKTGNSYDSGEIPCIKQIS